MSEPIRTSPTQRKQLAAALKRNMARRKAVGSAHGFNPPSDAVEKRPAHVEGQGMPQHPVATHSGKGNTV